MVGSTFDFLYTPLNSFYWLDNLSFMQKAYWVALVSNQYIVDTSISVSYGLFSGNLFFFQLAFNVIFFVSVGIALVMYISNQGVRLLQNTGAYNLFVTSFSYLTDLEEDLGAADDAILFFLLFAIIILWFFFLTILTSYILVNFSWFLMLLNFIFITALMIPVFVLKSFGVSFSVYLRGVGRTKSLVAEVFFDIIAVAVMMVRFVIQNIRLLLIFIAFFELSEFISETGDVYGSLLFNSVVTYQFFNIENAYWYDIFGDFILQQVILIYYQAHLIVTFFAQLANYFLLSFVLFFFLYTTFILESHEKYFFYKKLYI